MLFKPGEPGEPKDKILLSQTKDYEQSLLSMCLVMQDHIYYFGYLEGLVGCSINIVDWHSLGKFVYIQVVLLYKAFVDKDLYSTGVY